MPSDHVCEECECGSVMDPKTELLTPVCVKKECNSICNKVMQGRNVKKKKMEDSSKQSKKKCTITNAPMFSLRVMSISLSPVSAVDSV